MIDIVREGGLWTLTLNRPDKANSLTAEMLERLAGLAEEGARDPELRALVLTGAGARVFSAGADLEEARAGLATSPLWERVSAAVAALPCLTIAALNGTLAGGAFIIYTAIKEITHLLTVDHIEHSEGGKAKSVMQAITLIVAMNLVFSFDSILSAMAIANVEVANIVSASGEVIDTFKGTVTDCKSALISTPIEGAVGCRPGKDYQVWLMAIAIIVSGIVMALMADAVAEFLKKNRMYEVLGLFILFLVGVLLVTEGAHLAHMKLFTFTIEAMSKSSFYLVIFVLVVTDIISTNYQKRLWRQREAELQAHGESESVVAAVDDEMDRKPPIFTGFRL